MGMTVAHLVALLGTGLLQGLCSSVLGAGGGWIMTPVQYWVYEDMGIGSDIAIRMTFGTSLFVILPVAAASAWGHHRRKAVLWRPALLMGLFGLLGSFGGAMLATYISAGPLKIVFGVIVLSIGLRMLVVSTPPHTTGTRDNVILWIGCALPISFMAGLIGVGGGVFLVPIMLILFRMPMHTAVATSAATIAMISVGGIVAYVIRGVGLPGIPAPSLGYIYIWAWLALAGTSLVMTQIGVRVAHALPARALTNVFSIAALYIGLRMVGAFDAMNLPL